MFRYAGLIGDSTSCEKSSECSAFFSKKTFQNEEAVAKRREASLLIKSDPIGAVKLLPASIDAHYNANAWYEQSILKI